VIGFASLPVLPLVVGAGLLTMVLAVAVGRRRWSADSDRLTAQLIHSATPPSGRVSLDDVSALPPPVRRYFHAVLRDGQPYVHTVRLVQQGEFRSRESPDIEADWRPFEASQRFTTGPPGFIWDARIRMVPLVAVRVRDAYVRGRARMLGKVFGLISVADAADTTQLQEGALQRYLAESVWFPTALLPRNNLRWTPIDDTHARATLTDGATSVSLDFEFGPSGEILGCSTPQRWRAAAGRGGAFEAMPWGGRYGKYEERGGMRVPMEAEVYWLVQGREQPYYRGRNIEIEYVFGETH
jgi:hypothetical protein